MKPAPDLNHVEARATEMGKSARAAAQKKCEEMGRHGHAATPAQLASLGILATNTLGAPQIRFCGRCWTAFMPNGEPIHMTIKN